MSSVMLLLESESNNAFIFNVELWSGTKPGICTGFFLRAVFNSFRYNFDSTFHMP